MEESIETRVTRLEEAETERRLRRYALMDHLSFLAAALITASIVFGAYCIGVIALHPAATSYSYTVAPSGGTGGTK